MGESRQFSQRLDQNRFVARPVMRRAERPSHGVIDESAARRRNFGHDVERRADHERGNALGFHDMRDETDGLVAKRSIGDDQRHIHFGSLQITGDGGSDFALDLLMAPEPAHERDVKW